MNRLAKNSIAAGLTTLLVTTGLSFSAFGADSTEAQANASALTSEGFADFVDSKVCSAMSASAMQGTGTCGTGLGTEGTFTYNQDASTGGDGTSKADASIEEVRIDGLTTIDLSTIPADLGAIDTGTALDDVIGALFDDDDPEAGSDGGGGILDGLLDLGDLFGEGGIGSILNLDDLNADQLGFLNDLGLGDSLGQGGSAGLSTLLQPILDAIQDSAVDGLSEAFDEAVPVSVVIDGITSQCTAVDGEGATGTSSIGSLNIVIELGDSGETDIVIPVAVPVSPNSDLVGGIAPQQILQAITQGIEDSLNSSFDGAAGPLAELINTLQERLVDELLEQFGNEFLETLGDAIAPILGGTVNKQVVGDEGQSIEVTALDLSILSLEGGDLGGGFLGGGGSALEGDGVGANLQLARVSCGPNGAVVVDNDDDNADGTNADGTNADGTNADGTNADADADANADGTPAASIADADSAADADVAASLPNAGAPNLLPFFLLGIALLAFGLAVLLNERRRLGLPSSDDIA